jgi:peptidyl-prolyl cis-trans isomerase SurA
LKLHGTFRPYLAIAVLVPLCLRADIIDRIAVSVGNRVITTSDLDRELRVTAFLNGVKPDFTPAGKRATAERMVEQRIIRNELETSRYPIPAASEVAPELEQFQKKYFHSNEEYRNALYSCGITDDDVKAELLWQRTLLLFIDVRFRPGVQVTNQELQDYFDQTVAPAARAAHPGQPLSIEDYRSEIEQKLVGEKVDRDIDRWLQQVRQRTEIVFHPEAFQ